MELFSILTTKAGLKSGPTILVEPLALSNYTQSCYRQQLYQIKVPEERNIFVATDFNPLIIIMPPTKVP
ncbi:hypothetical protein [Flavobacterium hercynium]|uniref:Uncharacterized protein n=1 Tax=Flavobacterium hercynium TaxID=387094 RepID=A0A226H8I4_9FLAO|nr:hypothetical protein [Flavobacterium hercynium]OXA89986.1 hypothetical protein B0A66_13345 [Flavobacterium hercynium]SMP14105.1 hypothetical protein SAMN06265346_10454 [Flavobacterium hercynium]